MARNTRMMIDGDSGLQSFRSAEAADKLASDIATILSSPSTPEDAALRARTSSVKPATSTKPVAENMPYDSSNPATTITMPYSGTTTPSVRNLDTVNTTTIQGINAASNIPTATPVTSAFALTGDIFKDTLNNLRAARGITPENINALGQLNVQDLTEQRVADAQASAAKPIMSAEQKAGGGVVTWIGGVNGEYQIVMPNGSPLVGSKAAGWEPGRNRVDGTPSATAGAAGGATGGTGGTGTGARTQRIPEGFTPGAFPKELERFFGQSPSDIMGYKITEYTNAAGQKYYKLSISQKGAYGDAASGSIEFGAPIVKGSNGEWTVFQGDYSTGSNIGDARTGGTAGGTVGGTAGGTAGGTTGGTGINGTFGTVAGVGFNTTGLTTEQIDAVAGIRSFLSSLGIGDLTDAVVNSIKLGYSADTIKLIMQDPNSKDPLAVAFQKRFPANKERLAAGKPAIDAADYLRAERAYAQIFQSYGVSNLANNALMSSFIAGDVSATEVSDRIALAVNRVQNADANTKAILKRNYPELTTGDIVGAMLNPKDGLPALQRKVQIAEIGGAALAQKLDTSLAGGTNASDVFGNVTTGNLGLEELASLGITKEEAQKGYGQIAALAPRSEFLSSITGGEDYTRLQAEQEVFGGLASAKRAREKLSETEVGRFSGKAGTMGSKSLGQTRAI